MAYRLKSKILSVISTILRPVEKAVQTSKALVGSTKYNFKFVGALISSNAPEYDFRKIRQIYRRFGFIRQGLAVYKHRGTSELPDITCDNSKARKVLIDRLHYMQIFEELPNMFQDLTVFGNIFYEILFDEEEIDIESTKSIPCQGIEISKEKDFKEKARRLKRVVGIKRLEPDYMRIVKDKYGRTIYYINMREASEPVILEKWRVIHILLDPLPGDSFGIGLIEGAIDDISALRMVEDLQLQLIKHDIYPFRIFKCPTNDVVIEVEAKLAEQERFGDLVVPCEVEMDQSTIGNASQDLRALMGFYKEKIFMDIGVPMQMLIEGTKTNRATATVQSDSFNQSVYSIMNQIYIVMEKFCQLVLLFEGIESDVVWNYKDIDRGGEQILRKEIVEWYKEGIVDKEDAISLLEVYGAFRYSSEKSRARVIKKSRGLSSPTEEDVEPLGLPGTTGQPSAEPEFGDRIADESNIDKPTKITDRIREKIVKPDGTKVEKTTERIKQSFSLAIDLKDSIMKCNINSNDIGISIINTIDLNEIDIKESSSDIEELCSDIDECINLYNSDKNKLQYEYLISKVCSDFSNKVKLNKDNI